LKKKGVRGQRAGGKSFKRVQQTIGKDWKGKGKGGNKPTGESTPSRYLSAKRKEKTQKKKVLEEGGGWRL